MRPVHLKMDNLDYLEKPSYFFNISFPDYLFKDKYFSLVWPISLTLDNLKILILKLL